MLLGFLIAGKRYTWRKVLFVFTIVLSVVLFMYKDKYETSDGENLFLGNGLVGMSLLFSGLCGAIEDRMRSIAKSTSFNFMFNLSLWSTFYHLVGVVALGEMPKFIDFVSSYPEILIYITVAICVGCVGQLFISAMLVEFGALPVSIVTTTRKFFSVILSVIIYQNLLTLRQWIASAMLFGALLLDVIFNRKKEKIEEPEITKEDDALDSTKQSTNSV